MLWMFIVICVSKIVEATCIVHMKRKMDIVILQTSFMFMLVLEVISEHLQSKVHFYFFDV